jgi:OOP family OmpA-OmpF porin
MKAAPLKKVLLMFCLMGVACLTVYAQDTAKPAKQKKFKVKKSIKLADRKMKAGNIYGASDLYEEVLEHKPDQLKIAWQLAQTYQASRDYVKAEKWYKHVADQKADEYPLAQYYYALMIKMNGRHAEAKTEFTSFIKNYKGFDTQIKKWAKTEADGCDLALKLATKPEKINLTHLGDSVNHAYSDISPVMWNDSTLLYAALPQDTILVIYPDSTTKPDHHIKFYSSQKSGIQYTEATLFSKFDKAGSHVANGAFSPDKQRFYFTICDDVSFTKVLCKIYVSTYEGGTWSEPVVLDGSVNTNDYTTTQPSVGTYKDNSEVLYFASDRPGGKGGVDIWYSIISKKGQYQAAANAGKINTDRDEATPYYDNQTGALYFSSNGLTGIGGYDVFKTTGKTNKWTDAENIGYPVNSCVDDMYFRFNKDKNSGYVVSNRVGVITLKSATCCDDIFAFDYFTPLNIAVQGYVYDEANPQTPLNGAKITLSLRKSATLDEDVLVNESSITNNQAYLFDVNTNTTYKLTGAMPGYLNSPVDFSTNGISVSDTLTVNIYLKKLEKNKAYALKNIYYDYNSAQLRDESLPTLDSLYTILIENPEINIELGSHTDSRGTDVYNANLSQKRAESVVKYLVGKGIPLIRLTAKGYGESQPVGDCSGIADCPTEGEGDCPCHQANRRSEFKIVDITNAPVDERGKVENNQRR